ncbi:31300_t:CDS:2 [Gigaspora margarita]|uniref:31300_t:CDS:1 n=1 Tax=Gigaspora margarita TaxID=4874 RepID=A0ABN7US49_GIGMA|nr:31300_t:CDS:2 [Gigaspora margarita]
MDHIQDFLIKHRYDFLKQGSVKMLHIVTRHEAFNELKKVFLETIYDHPDLLFNSDKFHQINKEKFIAKVWPFRRLLPDNLTEDMLRCHLDSDNAPLYNVFPTRGATIVVGKISNSNQLVGGYNPLDWYGNAKNTPPQPTATTPAKNTPASSNTTVGLGRQKPDVNIDPLRSWNEQLQPNINNTLAKVTQSDNNSHSTIPRASTSSSHAASSQHPHRPTDIPQPHTTEQASQEIQTTGNHIE